MWWGAEVDIPDGWVKCDGTNGTPDMTRRFAYGGSVAFPVGTYGGGWTHTHHFTSHSDEHNHAASASEEIDSLESGDEIQSLAPDGHYLPDTQGHLHTITVNPDTHDHYCESGYAEHTSPFASLIFIMKL